MTVWRSQALRDEHDLSGFDCGVPSLNEWLLREARRAQRSNTARTYVWTRPESTAVVAYYAVAPTEVRREEVGRGMSGGVTVIPAYLLARLALHRSLRGQGLGSELLFDALATIVAAADTAAGRLIVVDAVDASAFAFYEHHDFQPVQNGRKNRLVMKVATARHALVR